MNVDKSLDLMSDSNGEVKIVSEKLEIMYDGPALSDGTMDLDVLAPALLAIGNLFQASNKILYHKRQPLKVSIRAEMKKGSFHVILDIASQTYTFFSDPVVLNIMATIGFASTVSGINIVTLFQFVKWLKGRPYKVKAEGDDLEVTTNDNDKLIISQNVYLLYQNSEVLSHLNSIVKPLRQEGITDFSAHHASSEPITVSKAEAISFSFDEEIGSPNIVKITLDIITLSFDSTYAWRFHDGENTITARIEDRIFWDKIDNHEIQINKGDKAIVDMQTRQFRTPTGKLKKENLIIKIHDVTPSDQLSLFGSGQTSFADTESKKSKRRRGKKQR